MKLHQLFSQTIPNLRQVGSSYFSRVFELLSVRSVQTDIYSGCPSLKIVALRLLRLSTSHLVSLHDRSTARLLHWSGGCYLPL